MRQNNNNNESQATVETEEQVKISLQVVGLLNIALRLLSCESCTQSGIINLLTLPLFPIKIPPTLLGTACPRMHFLLC